MAKPTKTRKRLLIIGISILLVGGVTTGAILRKREAPTTVQTESTSRRNITETVVANGKIQPVIMVKISPEVSGEIIELPVKEGQQVNKGDLLLRIKPDFYLASRRSAEASYRAALAAKNLADSNLKKAEIELGRNDE